MNESKATTNKYLGDFIDDNNDGRINNYDDWKEDSSEYWKDKFIDGGVQIIDLFYTQNTSFILYSWD